MLATLRASKVDFVVIGPSAARARGAQLSGSALANLVLDIVPDRAPDNLGRLAAALNQMSLPRIRTVLPLDGLPIVLDAATFEHLPVLPLSTTIGKVTVLLHPPGATSTFAAIDLSATAITIDAVAVAVASVGDLLGGLAGGPDRADHGLLTELRRVQEADRHLTLTPERDVVLNLERAVESVLSSQDTPATIREIFLLLGGRTRASYTDVRDAAEALAARGRLLRRRDGQANRYRINDDHRAQTVREIARLLATVSDPVTTARLALEQLPDDRSAVIPPLATRQ
jgi:predicted Zn-ribbon and HTH transcriptional regulator